MIRFLVKSVFYFTLFCVVLALLAAVSSYLTA